MHIDSILHMSDPVRQCLRTELSNAELNVCMLVECRKCVIRARVRHRWTLSACVLLLVCVRTVSTTAANPQHSTTGNENSKFTDLAPAPAFFVQSFVTDCELHVLNLLGWQQLHNPKGYNLAEEMPSNCSMRTWQSLGCLKALKKLTLTGSLLDLPDSWANTESFPALETLILSSAALGGSLPSSWGQPSAFPKLKSMHLEQTQLTGTLPSAWAQPGAFSRLEDLNLSYTLLSGILCRALFDHTICRML